MSSALRTTSYVLIGLVIAAAIGLGIFLFLTRTQPGLDQVRTLVIGRLEGRMEGDLQIGHITAHRLLTGATLHDVSIRDDRGQQFLTIDSISGRYNWRTLFAGDFVFDRVVAYNPRVIFERLPGEEEWNYQRIFPDDEEPSERSLIALERTRIVDGEAVVRFPWEPDGPVSPEDTARVVLDAVPGGLVRELRFDSIEAVAPRVIWESPEEDGQLYEIASLSTLGYIWEDPFDLEDFAGTATRRDSVLAFEADRIVLPSSEGSGIGEIVLGEERTSVDLRIDADDVAFSDLQWLYPSFPDEGGGRTALRVQTQDPIGTLWLATDAKLRTPGTEIAGDFGIVTGDTLYFTQVDLVASPLDLSVVQAVLPVDLPVEGLLIGTVVIEGPISSLVTSGDMRLVDRGAAGRVAPRVAARWSGTVDLRPPYAARNLEAVVDHLDLSLLSTLYPDVPLDGSISGEVALDGDVDGALHFAGSVEHHHAESGGSRISGTGVLGRADGVPSIDAELLTEPIILDAVARLGIPGLDGLNGELRGPLSVHGPLGELAVNVEAETAAGGLAFTGLLDLTDPTFGYSGEGRVSDFRVDRIIDGMVATELTGTFRLEGQGLGLARARTSVHARIENASVLGLPVHDASVRGQLVDGLLRVDTLEVVTEAGVVSGRGNFGLTPQRRGSLRLEVRSDSLAALAPVLSATILPPEDSLESHPVAGTLALRADVEGTMTRFGVQAEASLRELTYDRVTAESATVQLSARRLGTDAFLVNATAAAESLAVHDRPLTSARLRAEYSPGGGDVTFDAHAPGNQSYTLAGGFEVSGGTIDLDLRDLDLNIGTVSWQLEGPSRIRTGRNGLAIDELAIRRSAGTGHIRAAGQLPWLHEGDEPRAANLRVDFEDLRIGELLRIARPETGLGGVLTGHFEVSGTSDQPRVEGSIDGTDVQLGEVRVQRFDGSIDYADRRLSSRAVAHAGERPILTATASVPLDLSLQAVDTRLLPQPLDVSFRADSLPAAMLMVIADGFQNVEGYLDGTVTIGGTTKDPTTGGVLVLDNGSADWTHTGAHYQEVDAVFRLLGDRVVAVEANGLTEDGSATADGTLSFASLGDPELDLTLRVSEFQLARRRDFDLVSSGQLYFGGTYAEPNVSGNLHFDRGVINLDELLRQQQIIELESQFLFDVVDTLQTAVQPFVRESDNRFMRNLVVNATIDADRSVWLRNRDLNAEVSGELTVAFDRPAEELRLFGTLNVVRGHYLLYGRRFEVREGTIEFTGLAGVNPALDATAAYRASRTAEGDPLDVQALVSGTLQQPRVELASDVEPPISQSDLASYVVFGRPTYDLTPGQTTAFRLGMDVVGPSFLGYAASGLESVAAENLGVDYLAFTTTEFAPNSQQTGIEGLFAQSQLELGRYLHQNLFLSFTQRIGVSSRDVRLEWRFHPTWNAEFFAEDRFARAPAFGREQTLDYPTVYGFFLFREWGY